MTRHRRNTTTVVRLLVLGTAAAVVSSFVVPLHSERATAEPSSPPAAHVASWATSEEPVVLPEPSQRYAISATLDPATHTIESTARIRLVNTATAPLHELWLHLYLNAFESDRTVFARETGGSLRDVPFGAPGGIELRSLVRTGDGEDLLAGAEPGPDGPEDRTELRVPLRVPLAPGATLEIEARFTSRLPALAARSGFVRDFHFVAQWFPKLAKLEPDGRFAHFPYRGHGEFYADFATYDVRVLAPRDVVIAATGMPRSVRDEGALREHRFVATPVHDFAFVAWPHFERTSLRVGSVEVAIYYPPGHGFAVRRHLEVVAAGLAHFGALYGPYPYERLVVVVPPAEAAGGAAMEYPMLFATDTPWWDVPGIGVDRVDDTTAHELAHQWFQGLVATDEVTHPFLDEGLATWAQVDLMRRLFGSRASAGRLGPIELDVFEYLRRWYTPRGRGVTAPASAATAFRSQEDYGRAVYVGTACVIETLARTYGLGRVRRALGVYARRHRFAHPGPNDLYRAFRETLGDRVVDRVLVPALQRGERVAVRATREMRGRDPENVARRVGPLPIDWTVEVLENGRARQRVSAPELATTADVGIRADPDRALLLDPTRLDDGSPGAATPPRKPLEAWALAALRWLLERVGP